MSGGYYNNLETTFPDDLQGIPSLSELRNLAEDLHREFPDTSADVDTRALLAEIEGLEERVRRLGEVWGAFEYWKSNDYSREQAASAVAKYQRP